MNQENAINDPNSFNRIELLRSAIQQEKERKKYLVENLLAYEIHRNDTIDKIDLLLDPSYLFSTDSDDYNDGDYEENISEDSDDEFIVDKKYSRKPKNKDSESDTSSRNKKRKKNNGEADTAAANDNSDSSNDDQAKHKRKRQNKDSNTFPGSNNRKNISFPPLPKIGKPPTPDQIEAFQKYYSVLLQQQAKRIQNISTQPNSISPTNLSQQTLNQIKNLNNNSLNQLSTLIVNQINNQLTKTPANNQMPLPMNNQMSPQRNKQFSPQINNQMSPIKFPINAPMNSQTSNQMNTPMNNQMCNQINTQIKNQMNTQIKNQMSTQMKNQMNTQMKNQMNTQMNTQMNNQMNKQMKNQMNTQMNNQMNTQMNNQMNTQMNNQMNAQMNNPVCNSFNNFANNKINNQLINQKSAPFPNAIPANQIVSAQNVPRSQNNFAPNIMYQNNIQPNIQQNVQSNMQLTVANSFQNNKNMPIINPVQNLNMGKNIPVSAQPQPAIIHIIPVQTQPVIQISPVNYAQVPSSNVVIPPLNHRSPNAENQAPLKKQFQGTIQHIIQKPKDNQNNNSSLTQEMPTKLQNTTSKTVTVIKSKPSISFPSIENLIKDKSESSESRDHIFVDSSTDDQEETNNEYNDDANYIHHHNKHNNPNENPQFYQQNLANAHQFPVISDFVTVFTQTDTNVRNKTTSDVSVQASANYNATSVQTEQFPPDIIIQ